MNADPWQGTVFLGEEDFCLLRRLRAVALILHMARDLLPGLEEIGIALWLGPTGRLHSAELASSRATGLLASLAGWPNLCREAGGHFRSVAATNARLAAESPTAPIGLRRLLLAIGTGDSPHPADAELLRAGWRMDSRTHTLRPIPPLAVSAHETIEALLEAGGGTPLARLAAQAAALLAGGAP